MYFGAPYYTEFDYLGWKGEGAGSHIMHSAPPALKLTPSQWATGWFFGIVALLFLAQSFLGGVLAHYRVETGAFYGLDIARWLPYNLARTWHLQLAIFWIATAWVGGGLFLASWVGGGEPRHQRTGVYALLGALVVVVIGSLAGESLGINDKLGQGLVLVRSPGFRVPGPRAWSRSARPRAIIQRESVMGFNRRQVLVVGMVIPHVNFSFAMDDVERLLQLHNRGAACFSAFER